MSEVVVGVSVTNCDMLDKQASQESGGGMSTSATEKQARGRAGEFRVALELCRRKMVVALRMRKKTAKRQNESLLYI